MAEKQIKPSVYLQVAVMSGNERCNPCGCKTRGPSSGLNVKGIYRG